MQERPRNKYPDLYYRVRNKRAIDLIAKILKVSLQNDIFIDADFKILYTELDRIGQVQQAHQKYKEASLARHRKSRKTISYIPVSEEEHFKTINNNRRQRIALQNANSSSYQRASRIDTTDD